MTERARARDVWRKMIKRCHTETDPGYYGYGARGIVVCERWRQSFDAFYQDMWPRPEGMSIDRVDNDGPYSPDNCRWATLQQQRANQRMRKVTPEVIARMGELRRSGLSYPAIAELILVSRSTVYRVLHGRHYLLGGRDA